MTSNWWVAMYIIILVIVQEMHYEEPYYIPELPVSSCYPLYKRAVIRASQVVVCVQVWTIMSLMSIENTLKIHVVIYRA